MPVEKIDCKACNDTGFTKRARAANGEMMTASAQGWFYCNAPGCSAAKNVQKRD